MLSLQMSRSSPDVASTRFAGFRVAIPIPPAPQEECARSRNHAITPSSNRMVIRVFPRGISITAPRLALEKSYSCTAASIQPGQTTARYSWLALSSSPPPALPAPTVPHRGVSAPAQPEAAHPSNSRPHGCRSCEAPVTRCALRCCRRNRIIPSGSASSGSRACSLSQLR
jgi:hypothetical protein